MIVLAVRAEFNDNCFKFIKYDPFFKLSEYFMFLNMTLLKLKAC